MEKKLQQLLRKYSEEELMKVTLSEVHNVLNEALNDVTCLTKKEIEFLIRFQDEEGCFRLTSFWDMPSDAKQDYIYYPSYLITLILINVSLQEIEYIDEKIIEKALDFCVSRKFVGHGFEAYETQNDVAILFAKNNILKYVKKHPSTTRQIIELLDRLLSLYERNIQEEKTYTGWNLNLKDKHEQFISLYDQSIYYIAYGSNLNKEQMLRRCPNSKVVGTCKLQNYKLKFNLYLTIEKEENSYVNAGIWKITKSDEKSLDYYEGYPFVYRKEYMDIKVNNKNRKCIVYIMNDIPERKDVPPTREYLERCIKGYKDFNFDIKDIIKII